MNGRADHYVAIRIIAEDRSDGGRLGLCLGACFRRRVQRSHAHLPRRGARARSRFLGAQARGGIGAFELVAERVFRAPIRFNSCVHFEERLLGVTHTQHRLTESRLNAVRERFMRHVTPQGAASLQPMRVDLLRKPALQIRTTAVSSPSVGH
jgi:hypothetical protein